MHVFGIKMVVFGRSISVAPLSIFSLLLLSGCQLFGPSGLISNNEIGVSCWGIPVPGKNIEIDTIEVNLSLKKPWFQMNAISRSGLMSVYHFNSLDRLLNPENTIFHRARAGLGIVEFVGKRYFTLLVERNSQVWLEFYSDRADTPVQKVMIEKLDLFSSVKMIPGNSYSIIITENLEENSKRLFLLMGREKIEMIELKEAGDLELSKNSFIFTGQKGEFFAADLRFTNDDLPGDLYFYTLRKDRKVYLQKSKLTHTLIDGNFDIRYEPKEKMLEVVYHGLDSEKYNVLSYEKFSISPALEKRSSLHSLPRDRYSSRVLWSPEDRNKIFSLEWFTEKSSLSGYQINKKIEKSTEKYQGLDDKHLVSLFEANNKIYSLTSRMDAKRQKRYQVCRL